MASATVERAPRVIRDEQGGTFRIIVGIHLGDGPTGCDCDDCHKSGGKNHVYEAYDAYAQRTRRDKREVLPPDQYTNDLVESKQDLCRRCNVGLSRKFERADGVQSGESPELALLRSENARLRAQLDAQPSATPGAPAPPTSAPGQLPTTAPVPPSSPTPPTTANATFESMTTRQLTEYAAAEEIDLKGAKTRDEMLKAIRARVAK